MAPIIGIIGGSGIYSLPNLQVQDTVTVETPFGTPSDKITIATYEEKIKILFLPRHGKGHIILPSNVNSQANIAALKHLGAEVIIAFSAVGSLQLHIKPEDFVLPNQIIDRTFLRNNTFFNNGMVGHTPFADPFSQSLIDLINESAPNDLKIHTKASQSKEGISHPVSEDDVTVVCMEGPAFSTRAESRLYRSWGGSVINMSVLPEAKLAREAEISYAIICMATDYDCWKVDEASVDVAMVLGHMKNNGVNASRLLDSILKKLTVEEIERIGAELRGSQKFAVQTSQEARSPEMAKKLEYLKI